MEKFVFDIGIVSIICVLILKLLAIIEEIANTKLSIESNLNQLNEYDFGNKAELDAKRKYLYELNDKISKQLNIKAPALYLQDNDTNNAVAINTGLFQAVIFEEKTFVGLNSQGLGAVLAHELYHIKQKHYLKSLFRISFFSTVFSFSTVFLLTDFVYNSKFSNDSFTGVTLLFLMFFYLGVSFAGEIIATIFDRFMSRKQEIDCDRFAASATSFGDYLIQAHYFNDYEHFWLKPQKGMSSIASKFYNTHPSWDKRIVAVASVDPINRK